MKTNEYSKKGLYIGAGVGIVLFAIIGLLPGSFIGGVIGLNIAGRLFAAPLDGSIMPRIIVALSMLAGVMLSALVFTVGSATAGWLIGHIADVVRFGHKQGIEAVAKGK